MYENEDIDLIAKAYSTIRMIDATIKSNLDALPKMDSTSVQIPEEILKKCRGCYEELCKYFADLPETVQEYPLIEEAKKTLDDRVGLLHLCKD